MSVTVEISLGDDGKVTVGLADDPAEPENMQPAASVQAALAMAKHLLAQGQSEDQVDDQNDPNDTDSNAASDPKAIWDQIAQQNQPPH